MALITCPECGQQVSDTAKTCPHCGYVLKKTVNVDFAAGAQKATEAVNAIRDVKKVVNPFKVFGYKKWASAFKSKQFLLYLLIPLVIIVIMAIGKGVLYSLVLMLIPYLVLLLRSITHTLFDKEFPGHGVKTYTLMPYDDLICFMLAFGLSFGKFFIVLFLSGSVLMAVMAVLKMATMKQMAFGVHECPECGHTVAEGRTECENCSCPVNPGFSQIKPSGINGHWAAAGICCAIMFVGGLVLSSTVHTKRDKWESLLYAIQGTYDDNYKRRVCSRCGEVNFGNFGLDDECKYGGHHVWVEQ